MRNLCIFFSIRVSNGNGCSFSHKSMASKIVVPNWAAEILLKSLLRPEHRKNVPLFCSHCGDWFHQGYLWDEETKEQRQHTFIGSSCRTCHPQCMFWPEDFLISDFTRRLNKYEPKAFGWFEVDFCPFSDWINWACIYYAPRQVPSSEENQ